MLFFLLFTIASMLMLPDVWSVDRSLHHGGKVDGVPVSSLAFGDERAMDLVKSIVKDEMDKSWSKIVSDLHQKVVSQDIKIKNLEGKEKRRNIITERLISKVLNIEKKCKQLQAVVGNEKHGYLQTIEKASLTQGKGQTGELSDNTKFRNGQKHGQHPKKVTVRTEPVSMIRRQAAHVIAFTAYLDRSMDQMSLGNTVKFNQVLLNDGNAYNTHTGIFTTPVTGLYLFSFHFNSRHHKTWLTLVIDNVNQVDAISSPQNDHEVMAGHTVVLRVTKGQSVWLEDNSPNGEIWATELFRVCSFSSVLLY